MASEIRSTSQMATQELRMKNYVQQLERKHDQEVRQVQENHGLEITKLLEGQAVQKEQMEGAYELEISHEAEALEEKLHRARMDSEKREIEEREAHARELTKLKTLNEQQLREYKKQAEETLDKTRKEFAKTTEVLHERARKSAQREKGELKT